MRIRGYRIKVMVSVSLLVLLIGILLSEMIIFQKTMDLSPTEVIALKTDVNLWRLLLIPLTLLIQNRMIPQFSDLEWMRIRYKNYFYYRVEIILLVVSVVNLILIISELAVAVATGECNGFSGIFLYSLIKSIPIINILFISSFINCLLELLLKHPIIAVIITFILGLPLPSLTVMPIVDNFLVIEDYNTMTLGLFCVQSMLINALLVYGYYELLKNTQHH
ncbi:hypothetical protein SAMN05421767_102104 [Granulicatella balaenopterae]|uniref:ABC-2 family transporter protein n=1 Tax=Granulicatella balaenopterae TaxID=137733 RepID=A0A1H9HHU9_9LACT|nr:hypothetical protein [Granulicatella balaenopterae]SEQ61887.1 hypothetical protein SAMN05421767_102104 [Granulicatella balaenopterae]